jgi:hypothetical protein
MNINMEKQPQDPEKLDPNMLVIADDGDLMPAESREISPKNEKRAALVRKIEELDREIDRIKTLAYAARNENEGHRIEQENGLSKRLAERMLAKQELEAAGEVKEIPLEEIETTDIEDIEDTPERGPMIGA